MQVELLVTLLDQTVMLFRKSTFPLPFLFSKGCLLVQNETLVDHNTS